MRKKRIPKPICNPLELAMRKAALLDRAMVADMKLRLQLALDEWGKGRQCLEGWISYADAYNLVESLGEIGVVRGEGYQDLMYKLNLTLAELYQRGKAGSWTMKAEERSDLLWLAALHATLLEEISQGEFEKAFDLTVRRKSQALAGNASPGSTVFVGRVGRFEE